MELLLLLALAQVMMAVADVPAADVGYAEGRGGGSVALDGAGDHGVPVLSVAQVDRVGVIVAAATAATVAAADDDIVVVLKASVVVVIVVVVDYYAMIAAAATDGGRADCTAVALSGVAGRDDVMLLLLLR